MTTTTYRTDATPYDWKYLPEFPWRTHSDEREFYNYTATHIPSGRSFPHMHRFGSPEEFRKALAEWNAQLPEMWRFEEDEA